MNANPNQQNVHRNIGNIAVGAVGKRVNPGAPGLPSLPGDGYVVYVGIINNNCIVIGGNLAVVSAAFRFLCFLASSALNLLQQGLHWKRCF